MQRISTVLVLTLISSLLIALFNNLFVVNAQVRALPGATKTPTASRTKTSTVTVTPSPTVTITPTQTPVKKTELKIFDSVTVAPGDRIASGKIDVKEFTKVSIFLSTINGDINTAVCYFVPDGGSASDRYQLSTISVATGTQAGYNQAVKTGDIIGPNLTCEVSNYRYGTNNVSMYLYLIP
jgi:hypothetical protein